MHSSEIRRLLRRSSAFASWQRSLASGVSLPTYELKQGSAVWAMSVSHPRGKAAGTKPLSCNTCGGCFENTASYREHFRSEWHRFNLKLKMQGAPPVTQEEFDVVDAPELLR